MKSSYPDLRILVQDITKSFGSTKALDRLTLAFTPGLMHGVIGPEGAGKTTLIRLILGLLIPSSGTVSFDSNGVAVPFEDIRPHVAYMPQQQSLYPDLSIDEHLDFFKSLYGISQSEFKTKRDELLHMARLTDFVDRPAGKLSGGMYKKLGLICALLRSPQIMLLDEPTNGVDPISRREFWELLYRLLDQNILIVVSTAYMDEAERCGEVHLISGGKLVTEGKPRDLLRQNHTTSFDDLFLKQEAHS